MFEKKNILKIGVTNASEEDILEYITKSLENKGKKWYIVTVNPEILTLANKNSGYKKILNSAKLALTDGIGVVLAGKILGRPLKGRVTGVDLLENICRRVSEKPITVGFLGGGPGVAEATAECLREKNPGLRVGFTGSEWPDEFSARQPRVADDAVSPWGPAARFPHPMSSVENLPAGTRRGAPARVTPHNSSIIHNSQFIIPSIDILFVAFGAPKQEIWISQNLNKIPVKVAMGVGGAFDYISGRVPRAPLLIRLIGFEWLYRLIRQPWRWKRQLALLEFIWLVLKEKLK